jgi:hypothetical protein
MALKWNRQRTITEFVPEVPIIYLKPQAHGAPLEVRVRFISHAFHNKRPVLCIEIEDGTTQENIASSWDELKRLRRELNETRGPYDRPGGGASNFYRWAWKTQEAGYTWEQIAASVNKSIKQALSQPDDPLAMPGIPAAALLAWCCGNSRGQEPPTDLQPEDVHDKYPVTGEALKARVRTWRDRYRTS